MLTIVFNTIGNLSFLTNIAYIPFVCLAMLDFPIIIRKYFPVEFVILLLFIIVAILSMINRGFLHESLMACYSVFSLAFLVFLSVYSFDAIDAKIISKVIVVSSFILAVISFGIGNSSGRLGTGVTNSINLAIVLCLSSIFFSYKLNKGDGLKYMFFLFCSFVLILLTETRSALIFSIMAFVICFVFIRTGIKIWKKILLVLFVASFLYVGFESSFITKYTHRFSDITEYNHGRYNSTSSVSVRLYYKNLGYTASLDKPILGHGIGTTRIFLKGSYFHDNYVELLYETGFWGIGLYVVMHIVVLVRAIKQKNILSALLILFILFYGFFDVTYHNKVFYITYSLAILLLKNKPEERNCLILERNRCR